MKLEDLYEANRLAEKLHEVKAIQKAREIRIQYMPHTPFLGIEDNWITVPKSIYEIDNILQEQLMRTLMGVENTLEHKLARL